MRLPGWVTQNRHAREVEVGDLVMCIDEITPPMPGFTYESPQVAGVGMVLREIESPWQGMTEPRNIAVWFPKLGHTRHLWEDEVTVVSTLHLERKENEEATL